MYRTVMAVTCDNPECGAGSPAGPHIAAAGEIAHNNGWREYLSSGNRRHLCPDCTVNVPDGWVEVVTRGTVTPMPE